MSKRLLLLMMLSTIIVLPLVLQIPSVSAAYVFSDSFESGSFSKWTGRVVTSGETATVVTTRAYRGTHSARFTTNGGGGYERAYCYRSIAPMSVLNVRGYFYVSKSGIVDVGDRLFFIILRAGSNSLVYAGWKKISTQPNQPVQTRWCITVKIGSTYTDFTGLIITEPPGYVENVPPPVLNRWYRVELSCTQDPNGASEVVLYVNGIQATATQNKYGDIPWPNPISTVRFGFAETYGVGASTVYADSCVIDKTLIGPA